MSRPGRCDGSSFCKSEALGRPASVFGGTMLGSKKNDENVEARAKK